MPTSQPPRPPQLLTRMALLGTGWRQDTRRPFAPSPPPTSLAHRRPSRLCSPRCALLLLLSSPPPFALARFFSSRP
eukprot:5063354-Pleurochrysis_carterae.AAC.1